LNNETKEINMTATQTILPLKSGKKNFITRLQSSQLHGWLQSLGAEVSQRSAGELARRATEHLGFLVTDGNVSGLRKQMGLAPGGRRGVRKTKPEALSPAKLSMILKELDQTRARIDDCLTSIQDLLFEAAFGAAGVK